MESEQRTPFLTEAISSAPVQVSKYDYNLAGALTEETYPSGRVVKNTFNANGDLSAITSKAANTAYAVYASNFSYTATGLISKLELGNGRWETAKFNTRQQITELALGTTQTDTSLWKLNYDYDEQFGGSAPAHTGNISKQTITFAGQANPFVQNYKYDSLNRITEAKETSGSATNWQQNYSYDRYGNRIDFAQSIGGQSLALNSLTLPEVDSTTNRFTDTQTYHYDKTGNITTDQTPAGTRNFTFNGDNKQVEIRDPAVAVSPSNPDANVIGKYYYDGEGKRVKKVTASEVTIFVYSAGKLAEEYSTEVPPATPTINYVHTDTLQSVRAVSDKLGNIISRRDFMPYGEDLTAGTAGRLATDKYTNGADAVRQRFTGYEKDQESGLDFAEARYYNNQHGRFTAVDPLLASGKSANPQTFNRYVYVGNSPLNIIDPNGTDWYYLNNEYRWSSDNVKFDRTLSHPFDPGSVDGWEKVLLDKNGEHRYYTAGSIPGVSVEIYLTNKETDFIGNHWDYTGNNIISDQAAYDNYNKEQAQKLALAKNFSEGISAIEENQAQNDALRPLTDTKTGTFYQSPGNLNIVFDRMIQAEDGGPVVGPNSRNLSGRALDYNSGTGKSVSQNPESVPDFKRRDQLFAFPAKIFGIGTRIDPDKPDHFFIQPRWKPISEMTFDEYTEFIQNTRISWKPVTPPNSQK